MKIDNPGILTTDEKQGLIKYLHRKLAKSQVVITQLQEKIQIDVFVDIKMKAEEFSSKNTEEARKVLQKIATVSAEKLQNLSSIRFHETRIKQYERDIKKLTKEAQDAHS